MELKLPNIDTKGFDKEAIEDEVLNNNYLRKFIYNNDLSHDELENNMTVFLDFLDDSSFSEDGSYESKRMPGYKMVLKYRGGSVQKTYVKLDDENPLISEKLKTISLPKEARNATLSDFSLVTEQRRNALRYARLFINSFDEKDNKGLYIAGTFRTGKSYLATAIAKEIALKGHDVLMVYYPELSSTLKGLIGTEEFLSTVEELKNVDLLILDDFGGESPSPIIRDEVLGVVLQYRMTTQKPVIFTSNISVSRLADASLRRDGSEGETIKALRIVERIKEITTEIILTERYKDNNFSN